MRLSLQRKPNTPQVPVSAATTSARWLAALGFLLLATTGVFAISFQGYQQQVKNAKDMAELLRAGAEDNGPSFKRNLGQVREALPRTERVEWQSTSLEADNSWLHDDLDEVESMAGDDRKRTLLIVRIQERLQALAERLEEVEKSEQVNGPGKDELKGKLAGILQRTEFSVQVKQESALNRLLREFFNWIWKLLRRGRPLSPATGAAVSNVVQIVVACLAVAVLVYFIWLAAPRLLRKSSRKKKVKKEARVVLGERLEPDQSGADLLAEAESLARAGDLRGAIRKGYIALLVELGDRKVISLAQYKTNRDYLRSVREIESLYGNMTKLTGSFELHWYGLAQASESDWTTFRAFYRAALSAS